MIITLALMLILGVLGLPAWLFAVLWITTILAESKKTISESSQKNQESAMFEHRVREVEREWERIMANQDRNQPEIIKEANRIINRANRERD